MGLDMYLKKGKKIPKIPFKKYVEIDDKICGGNEELKEKYKEYTHENGVNFKWHSLFEEVGYWRKANHIHNWFVENVQKGVDDCNMYQVKKQDLEKLLEDCLKVVQNSKLVKDKVYMGTSYSRENGEQERYEEGYVIEDSSVAQMVLPRQEGFFFGGTNYDQFYYQDILETINICLNLLKWTNFDEEYITYQSSW